MTTATLPPQGLIERVYKSGANLSFPPEDRAEAVRWLRRALVDFESLDQHIAILQELAGVPFTYPRPRRDRWPGEIPTAQDPVGFRSVNPLPAKKLEAVLNGGPEALANADLVELLVNPFALFDTFDAIDETQPDVWVDEMASVGREIAGAAVTVPSPKFPAKPERSSWLGRGVVLAALATCVIVGVLVGRFTKPSGDSDSAELRRQLDVARADLADRKTDSPLRGQLVRGATEMQSNISDHKLPLRRIWNANYVEESPPAENLQRLIEAGPPEIRDFVANQRKAGLADFEILTLIKQAVEQSPKE